MKYIWELIAILVIGMFLYAIFIPLLHSYEPPLITTTQTPQEAREAITDCFKQKGRYVAIKTEFYGSDGDPVKPDGWTVECRKVNKE